MKRVAIFRSELLPMSETFIRDQACALSSWHALLVGRREVNPALPTPGIDREIVPEASGARGELRFWLSLADSRMVTCLRECEVDLVHAHFGTDATDIWPTVRAAGLPMLVTLHGYDINTRRRWWEGGHGGLRRRTYPRRLLAMARDPSVAFVAVSQAIRRRAVDFGIAGEKIRVAYTGVDTNRFRPGGSPIGQRRPRVLFVARMVENKCPAIMVSAFAGIKSRLPDAELVMVGGGPLLAEVRGAAMAARIDVDFRGVQPVHEVLKELHEAKVLCLPSQEVASGASEGLGQVLLEAQACGVPVVGANTGGIPEALLDGVTGYLFPAGDEVALREAILRVLLAPGEQIRHMSAACRRFVMERFDMNASSGRLQELYDRAVAAETRGEEFPL